MPRGGKRAGAGRKPGIPNKINHAARVKALESGQSPLDVLLELMRTAETRSDRLNAAVAAAPYVHAKYQTVAMGQAEELGPVSIAWEGDDAQPGEKTQAQSMASVASSLTEH